MKIINCQQGSKEWFAARAGLPTASAFHRLVTPLWKIRSGEGPNTYMQELLAERWMGRPLDSFTGFGALEQGAIREEQARPFLAMQIDREIETVGFITTDDGRAGCSPDGLVLCGSGGFREAGAEIKCPQPAQHISNLLEGGLPADYAAQVHGSMFVTGLPVWYFLSFHPAFPPLLSRVDRDEASQKVLKSALDGFLERLDAAWQKLIERYGQPERPAIERERVEYAN